MISQPVVLVTGASRGLGKAVATSFAKKGYAVGINFRQHEENARKTADELAVFNVPTLLLKTDVSQPRDVEAMVIKIADEWGRLDVLVNNAGIVRNKTIVHMKDEEWREVLAVNLDGTFYCIRAVLPLMRTQNNGAIINFTSFIANKGVKGAANYAVSKAGVMTLTKNTAIEEGPHNIRVNAIMPGFHVTDMNEDVWKKFGEHIRAEHLIDKMPDRAEMADFVVSIAEMKSVSGQVFSFESRLL